MIWTNLLTLPIKVRDRLLQVHFTMYFLVILGCFWGISNAQYAQNSQPVYQDKPRQVYAPAPVHYVNIGAQLQGDYKFGYDTGKGSDGQSFREETRLPDGSVQGAYGYVDATGRQRIVKYTAGKNGFVAQGDVGPDGAPKATSPGPAPQAQAVAPQGYRPQPAAQPPQYGPPSGVQYQASNDVSNGRYYA